MALFTSDAIVRNVLPKPPAPEMYFGTFRTRDWVSRRLSVPFRIEASNYRSVRAVVTWAARFPLEGSDGEEAVSEAVFDGDRIHDLIP